MQLFMCSLMELLSKFVSLVSIMKYLQLSKKGELRTVTIKRLASNPVLNLYVLG